MAAQKNTPLLGYPSPIGNKELEVFDHNGPPSYANIGTSSGAGDVIKASALGYGGFDWFNVMFSSYSFSGNYIVKVFTTSSGTTPAVSPGTGSSAPQIVLQWFTTSAAFGAISTEASNTTDLSAEYVRIYAVLV